jgi:hypothetical protein
MAEQHWKVVESAVENRVVQGRKMRVDTTVVATNMHYPADSWLLGDGARVLTRVMKKVGIGCGWIGQGGRDPMRCAGGDGPEVGSGARVGRKRTYAVRLEVEVQRSE